jgi:hypothetical protein
MYSTLTYVYTVDDFTDHSNYFIEATEEGFVAECNNLFCSFRSDPFEKYDEAEDAGREHSST